MEGEAAFSDSDFGGVC